MFYDNIGHEQEFTNAIKAFILHCRQSHENKLVNLRQDIPIEPRLDNVSDMKRKISNPQPELIII